LQHAIKHLLFAIISERAQFLKMARSGYMPFILLSGVKADMLIALQNVSL